MKSNVVNEALSTREGQNVIRPIEALIKSTNMT
jgi:hypothetical protein